MTPCFLFTKTASTFTWDQFKTFWPIPIFYVLASAISWTVARVGSRVHRFSSDEVKFVTASVMFTNANSLPIALIQSLALSIAGSRLLRDENDTREQVIARGISYIIPYTIFTNVVRWSYGFSLLVPKDRDDYRNVNEDQDGYEDHEGASRLHTGVVIDVNESPSATTSSSTQPLHTRHDESVSDEDEDEPYAQHSPDRPSFFRSSNKTQRSTHLRSFSRSVSESARQLTRPYQYHRQKPTSTGSLLMRKLSAALNTIRQVLSPPMLTAILGLIIGMVPVLHRLIMDPDSKIYSFIIRPIEGCGAGAIPMTLLCLGAQVVHFASVSSATQTSSQESTLGSTQPQTQSRHVTNTPSVVPYVGDDIESSSSEEDNTDQDWHRIQQSRRNRPGRYWLESLHSRASSSTTLHSLLRSGRQGGDDEDDEEWPVPSSYTGSNGLRLQSHRFKWVTPTVYILFSRLVLVPLLCLPAILFWPKSWAPMLAEDPAFRLTLVLLVASPSAINLIQLSQVKGFYEKEMAAVLFWSYCVFGLPCVLVWSLVGLWAAGR